LGSFAFEPVGADAPENVSPYPLRALVATGAHGKAYLAYSPTGRPVAVKVYRFGFGADPSARARFLRAVTVARSMDCEVAAPVLGAGFTMHRLWLATSYQAGPSLADAVFQHGPLPREGVRRLALALTRLVGELHLVGLSGRGMEPADVVLTPEGPRVVDLGFARVEGEAAEAVAEPSDALPGRYASGAAVLAEDVHHVGAVLYFAATGRMPHGETDDIVRPSVGNCPAALREQIAASLRANPARRPSLTELAAGASTAGVPSSTAAQWQSAPWLPDGVLQSAGARAAAVNELRRRDAWLAMSGVPDSGSSFEGDGGVVRNGGGAGWEPAEAAGPQDRPAAGAAPGAATAAGASAAAAAAGSRRSWLRRSSR
jgi:serine/threonine protein kinase